MKPGKANVDVRAKNDNSGRIYLQCKTFFSPYQFLGGRGDIVLSFTYFLFLEYLFLSESNINLTVYI